MTGLCGMLWVCCSFGERYVYLQRSTAFCFCASLGWQKKLALFTRSARLRCANRRGTGSEARGRCGVRAAGCRAHGTGYRVQGACMLKGSF